MWTDAHTILGPKRGQNGVKMAKNRPKSAKISQTAQNEPKIVKITLFAQQAYSLEQRPFGTLNESHQIDCKHPNDPIWTNSCLGAISGSRGCCGARIAGWGVDGLEPAESPKLAKIDQKWPKMAFFDMARHRPESRNLATLRVSEVIRDRSGSNYGQHTTW